MAKPLEPQYPEVKWLRTDELQTGLVPRPVSLDQREGVYVHSFKCHACSLHWMAFSWLAEFGRQGTIACPECGYGTTYLHWGATLTESPEFRYFTRTLTEIYKVHPWPGSVLLSDPGERAET
jgi:hypothetical protein